MQLKYLRDFFNVFKCQTFIILHNFALFSGFLNLFLGSVYNIYEKYRFIVQRRVTHPLMFQTLFLIRIRPSKKLDPDPTLKRYIFNLKRPLKGTIIIFYE